MTPTGYGVGALLMLFFSFVNVMGVRWLAETNKVVVWWKIAIPALTVVVLLLASFHPGNFTAGGGFNPFGWQRILSAVPLGGVIFAYLGFEQAIQLGAETRSPRRNIPFAVIGSMVIGTVLYLGLALAFIAALDPRLLSRGWSAVAFSGAAIAYGPYAVLFSSLGLAFFAVLIYIDAVISPAGTGLLYVCASSRLTFALARNRYVPAIFAHLSPRRVPIYAIAFSFLCGMLVFLAFPGWSQLVRFISAAAVIAYAMAPLAVGALRHQEPNRERPYRLWAGAVLAPLGFVVANEIILFSGWAVVWKLIVAIAIGFVLLGVSAATSPPDPRPSLDWRSGGWVWPYVSGLGVIAYLGSFGPSDVIPLLGIRGAAGVLGFGWDILAMAMFSLGIYYLAIGLRLPREQVQQHVGDLAAEAEPAQAGA